MEQVGELFSVWLRNIPGQVSPLLRRLVSNGVTIRDTWTMSYGDYKAFYVVPQQGRDAEQMTRIVDYFQYDYQVEPLYGAHIPLEAVEILDWLEEIRSSNGLLQAIASVPTDLANTSLCLCLEEQYREQVYEVIRQEYPFESFSDPMFDIFVITLPNNPSLTKLFTPLADYDIAFQSIALGTFQDTRQLYLVSHDQADRAQIEEALSHVQEVIYGMFWQMMPALKIVMANRTSIVSSVSCVAQLLGGNNFTAISTLLIPDRPTSQKLRYSFVDRG